MGIERMAQMKDEGALAAIRRITHRYHEVATPMESVEMLAALIIWRCVDPDVGLVSDDGEALPASLRWSKWLGKADVDLGRLLRSLEKRLRRWELEEFADIAKRLQNPETAQLFQDLAEWLNDRPFATLAERFVVLDTFDALLDEAGVYRTNATLTKLMVSLARPRAGESVYNPFCATAEGIVELQRQLASSTVSDECQISEATVLDSSRLQSIRQARCLLAGIIDLRIKPASQEIRRKGLVTGWGDDSPEPIPEAEEGFDLLLFPPVLKVMPVTGGGWLTEGQWSRLHRHVTGERYCTMRNIDLSDRVGRALERVNCDGRAIVVVPTRTLSPYEWGGASKGWYSPWQRSAGSFSRTLVESNEIQAIISLPALGVPSKNNQAMSIIVLRKGGHTGRIRKVDARNLFDGSGARGPKQISDANINKIVEAVFSHRESEYAWDESVERLEELWWDLTPVRKNRSGLRTTLDRLAGVVTVLPLSAIATIDVGGFRCERKNLPEKPPSDGAIAYVDAQDIKDGLAVRTRYLPDGVKSSFVLADQDILLHRSSKGAPEAGLWLGRGIDGVASNALFVITPNSDQVHPPYLAAVLSSAEYQAWFSDVSRGYVRTNLASEVLAELPVPLPPVSVQKEAADHFYSKRGDAFTWLTRTLLNEAEDPVQDWLERTMPNLPPDVEDASMRLASQISEEAAALQTALDHTGAFSLLSDWLVAIVGASRPLIGLHDVPDGPAKYMFLRDGSRLLRLCSDAVHGRTATEERARDFTQTLASWLDHHAGDLLSRCSLGLSVRGGMYVTGVGAPPAAGGPAHTGSHFDVPVVVSNTGPLPLRQIVLTTDKGDLITSMPFLAEGEEREVVHVVEVADEVITGAIRWCATRMDGTTIAGEQSFVAGLNDSALPDQDLGPSPYVTGTPVGPAQEGVFFGRERLMDQITRQVQEVGNVVLLEGNRRAGKSSILKHLEGAAIPGWIGVYCSLQGMQGSDRGRGVPTGEIFRVMAREIVSALRARKLNVTQLAEVQDDSAFEGFRDFLADALASAKGDGLRILLMLDEFDKLQEGIDSGVTSSQVPENIRYLVQNLPGFSVVLTGSRRMKRMREEYFSVLYGLGTRFDVTALDPTSARRLVEQPVRGRLSFVTSATDRVVELAARQPFLLQCLCNSIHDLAAENHLKAVSVSHVDQAARDLVRENEHFRHLWDYVGTYVRRLILMMAHRDGGHSLGEILDLLEEEGVEIRADSLADAIDELVEAEVMEKVGTGTDVFYRLAIPLLGLWIDEHQDYSAVRAQARYESEERYG